MLPAIFESLKMAFFMFWETLWALVLGFTLSGVVQAFVSRRDMERVLGGHGVRHIAAAAGFGVVSSSCSYAATAMAKSLFQKGADFIAALVFMFASTNLVIELGIVLWVLIGWQFTAAEFVGGLIMIVLLSFVGRAFLPKALVEAARPEPDTGMHHGEMQGRQRSTLAGWADAAGYTVADVWMLRQELLIGYLVAGFLAVLVPVSVWNAVFVHGHGFWTSLENVVVGPFIAIISFVCSIGNVPLAAALWMGGISFGGVASFIFADLITLPLLLIYRKYYGMKLTLRLLALFWLVMSAAGLTTEYLFSAIGLVPTRRPVALAEPTLEWNYTTILNIIFLLVFGLVLWLNRNRERFGGGVGYATDPVCGMQVEIATAPARAEQEGKTYYFCSEGCRDHFLHLTAPVDARR
ncbi:MAG TPA: permease [Chloroflexota bacterium]